MSNLVFPSLPGLTFPVTKTPMWNTSIQEATSGKETRIGMWSFPRWRWSLVHEFLRNNAAGGYDELWPLIGFFNRHYGAFDSWLFNDPDDNAVTDESFGTGNGTITQFQLSRSRGGFVEPVKDLNGAPVIKKAGVTQTTPANYSISSTGLVTFTSPPANGAALTWTGSFYWRCRFHDDDVSVAKFTAKIWEMKRIDFVSDK